MKNYITEIANEINAYIEKTLPRFFGSLSSTVYYALAGGKRLRGILLVLVGETLGASRERLLEYTLAVELAHGASLIHDDIVDESETRRGNPSLWKKYGLHVAVLLPHLMISTALLIISKAGHRALKETLDAWKRAAYGQLTDSLIMKNGSVEIDYGELVELKTGSIFEASCSIATYVAGSPSFSPIARRYGLNLGAAYQVLDDMVDVINGDYNSSGSSVLLRKIAGNNLYERGSQIFSPYAEEAIKAALELRISGGNNLIDALNYSLLAIAREGGEDLLNMVRDNLRAISESYGYRFLEADH